jgi:hypothetical protein
MFFNATGRVEGLALHWFALSMIHPSF